MEEDENEGLMPLKLKYYNYVLKKDTNVSKEEAIVFEIMNDFTDRRGLRQQWEQIDDEMQEEIIESWIEKAKKVLSK